MLKTKVGYSNIVDAYKVGVETAKSAVTGINAKVELLFNTVNYNQKKLIEGTKSVMSEVDIVGFTSLLGVITTNGYFIN